MKLIMVKEDLFKNKGEYWLAHCISSDLGMGAGIAVAFNEHFDMKNKLIALRENGVKTTHPTCIPEKESKVFNLITKRQYWEKPSIHSLRQSLELMREQAIRNEVKKIAMPKIGSGLDGLSWGEVEANIVEVFKDTEIEIKVCYI